MIKEKKQLNKFSVLTLGCSKNVYDSENLIGTLQANNFKYTEDVNKTDVLIINTCGFIQSAKEENIRTIIEAAESRKRGKLKKLIVVGCLSERYNVELTEQIKGVDNFFGTNASKEVLNVLTENNSKIELTGERHLLTPKHYAYLKRTF